MNQVITNGDEFDADSGEGASTDSSSDGSVECRCAPHEVVIRSKGLGSVVE